MRFVLYDAGADLLVGEEFDAGVGEDAEEGGGVAFEEAADTGGGVDVVHGCGEAGPGAGVFCELGVFGLEEDFHAVEGADYSFCLGCRTVSAVRLPLQVLVKWKG